MESKSQLKRATRSRKTFGLSISFFLLIALVFLILIEIGNTYNRAVLRDTYFLRLDVANIVPDTVPNYQFINTIARTVGLHDYYQFGLWNFCEGYVSDPVTECAKPRTLYWFDVVSIIKNELLAGATITLPTDATRYLDILRIASHWMFGLFLTGACLTFVLIFLVPLNIYSRWNAFILVIFVFLNALCVCVASAIGTAITIIFRNAVTSFPDLNIQAKAGTQMFAFMWIARGFTLLALIFQLGQCCCCASRRDVKTGRKRGSKHAYDYDSTEKGIVEPKPRRKWFGRSKA